MKRRVVLASLLALPLAAAAQGSDRMPKIGVLVFPPPSRSFEEAFRRGLRQQGYVEGKNIRVEWRAAGGSFERAEQMAAELVAMKVDVIVTLLTPAALAAKKPPAPFPS